ncbi:hypothetical protein BKA67DRAFT_539175 [Truncatella angustata]|uniref:Uncharacterized protein n=1 Tax=Truncatella angustata TaxID=152316 RepID=A0A9P8UFY1_9PEZI|nr:uncharacterized protein BKA67DRAFT_539175 [Truncatella angustata]KAH6649184.1 hypothetical protein BKA67DRAFT_539175 [Truncatella angustata]
MAVPREAVSRITTSTIAGQSQQQDTTLSLQLLQNNRQQILPQHEMSPSPPVRDSKRDGRGSSATRGSPDPASNVNTIEPRTTSVSVLNAAFYVEVLMLTAMQLSARSNSCSMLWKQMFGDLEPLELQVDLDNSLQRDRHWQASPRSNDGKPHEYQGPEQATRVETESLTCQP